MRVKFFRHGVMALTMSGLCFLAGCLDVPHPFRRTGLSQLSDAPPARLAVPLPTQALLVNMAAQTWQKDMVAAMLDQSVPAVGQAAKNGDWWLRMTATLEGNMVVPTYAVITPKGEVRGQVKGAPVPAASWSGGSDAVMMASAGQAAPEVATLLTGIQAAQMQKDPSSLKNRPAHVFFQGVRGAPGDGNAALARAFSASLRDAHDQVQHTQGGADFTVLCTVVVTQLPAPGPARQRLTLTWRVTDPHGKEAGAATQIHDIAAHALDRKWGDAAEAAGEEAAGGVRQIISRYSGRDNVPLSANAATVTAPPAASPPIVHSAAPPHSVTRHVPAMSESPVASIPAASTPAASTPVISTPVAPASVAPVQVVPTPAVTASPVPVARVAPAAPVTPPVVARATAVPAVASVPAAAVVASPAAPPVMVPATAVPTIPPSVPSPVQASVPPAQAVSTQVPSSASSATPSTATPVTVPARHLPGVTLPPR
ncbi:hypothetical protein [Novacetimonas hansenii]|uniref:hypothetical protein n=1 Tax=Novacetimonas hansenii TaxID=436 RepID=UPI0039ED5253